MSPRRKQWNRHVVRRLWDKAKGLCQNCFIELSVCVEDGIRGVHTSSRFPHIDHVIPLARGGADSEENLQLLCRPCNLRKGAR